MEGSIKMVMKDLPGSGSMVAILHEVSRNGDRIRKGPAPVALVSVDTRGGRPQPGHDSHPGGIAGRRGTIGTRKENPAAGEALKVGSPDWIPRGVERGPVIQVIDGDEENIGALCKTGV